MLNNLNGEIVLITGLPRAVISVLINPDNVIDSSAMSRNTDNRMVRRACAGGSQKIPNHTQTRLALKSKLLSPVLRKISNFQRARIQRRSLWKSSQELNQLRAQLLLPRFRSRLIRGAKSEPQRCRLVSFQCPTHRIKVVHMGVVLRFVWYAAGIGRPSARRESSCYCRHAEAELAARDT